ncbi:MAG: 16S rRNA (adenine(1518)-N(6)/adenine(1519)-N(6))-dimethyltransferase RsmA [Spirochaetota bacterium]
MDETFHYDSPRSIQKLLAEHGMSMNKRFGQNFLISRGGRESIVSELKRAAEGNGVYWEIGPGIGSLSHKVVEFAKELLLFEIDHGFVRLLDQLLSGWPNYTVVEGDVLKTWPKEYERNRQLPDVVFGNLPYNVGASCIASFIERGILPPVMIFTLQKEVVQRMSARPGTKQYSAFTVLCSLDYEVTPLFDLHPGSFYPAPDVVSSVVHMRRRGHSLCTIDERSGCIAFIHTLFSSRRKTALNNIRQKGGYTTQHLEAAGRLFEQFGLDRSVRSERLSPAQIVQLYRLITGPTGRA